jgi:CubicO group peptidase (beta-lactamase class C family)
MRAAALLLLACAAALPARTDEPRRAPADIDAEVAAVMKGTAARGLAIALVEDGRVAYVQGYGARNAAGAPLQPNTIMYGASLTKAAFAYMVMQLVDEGTLDLDASIARYLPKPLPEYPNEDKYAPWKDLAGDERWRTLTARILLTHGPGFSNFAFVEPDGRLRFHFEPGSRYAYSGEGFILLQFVLERGLGLDVGQEMQRRVFERFGMTSTSMMWRPEFAANLADGWDEQGVVEAHDERSKVRAAGSMDTTIADMARLAAGYVRGEGLSARARQSPSSPGSSASEPITGMSAAISSRLLAPGPMSADRRTSTPRMPTCTAPAMSCARLSPTITDSAAETSTSLSAASKMLGCGFMKPCCDDETAAVIRPSSSKWLWNEARHRWLLEMRPMRRPIAAIRRSVSGTSS